MLGSASQVPGVLSQPGLGEDVPPELVTLCVVCSSGPNTRSLHSLCWHVAGLAPLSSTRQKFHAFILGLLK